LTRGFGSDANPGDGDRVKIEVDLEGGVVMDARVTLDPHVKAIA
jgi:hypothetical protein